MSRQHQNWGWVGWVGAAWRVEGCETKVGDVKLLSKFRAEMLAVWHFSLNFAVPTKTQLSNFLGTSGEDYFKGNPKSLNFYFLVIWWGKFVSCGFCFMYKRLPIFHPTAGCFIFSEGPKIYQVFLIWYS